MTSSQPYEKAFLGYLHMNSTCPESLADLHKSQEYDQVSAVRREPRARNSEAHTVGHALTVTPAATSWQNGSVCPDWVALAQSQGHLQGPRHCPSLRQVCEGSYIFSQS